MEKIGVMGVEAAVTLIEDGKATPYSFNLKYVHLKTGTIGSMKLMKHEIPQDLRDEFNTVCTEIVQHGLAIQTTETV